MGDDAQTWKSLWREAPGRRFAQRHARLHRAGHSWLGGMARRVGGAALVLVGIVFLPLPGPGFVPILAGLALLAGESVAVAHALDRAELRVRRWLGR